ncbi:agouti-signaling protein 2b [Dunckerocampus dactyliophorus]|uniref:agouti-signaling protein 2b n=1 Tax=Dunckerocampus dactyliophorus TaxID=161453 RepID=UPI0024068F44|nr:agouti-signaling protein 2b [Dunckerocampus dactyliophorus]
MRKMKHFCLLLLIIPLCYIVDTKNVGQAYNDTENRALSRAMKLRAEVKELQDENADLSASLKEVKNPVEEIKALQDDIKKRTSEAATPVRRCSLLRESCSSHVPCCDPCASCRCRFFNIVCHCWRVNRSCLTRRKTPRMRIGIGTMESYGV